MVVRISLGTPKGRDCIASKAREVLIDPPAATTPSNCDLWYCSFRILEVPVAMADMARPSWWKAMISLIVVPAAPATSSRLIEGWK